MAKRAKRNKSKNFELIFEKGAKIHKIYQLNTNK
jgi:hypothetical protein